MIPFGSLRLRTRIALGIAALVVGTGLLLAGAAYRTASEGLKQEHRKRGQALVRLLAARSVDPLLAGDLLRLKNVVDDLTRADADVLYAFIQDASGRVAAHTYPGVFPDDLPGANVLPPDQSFGVLLLADGSTRIDDFAAAVTAAGDRIGTARLGITRQAIRNASDRITLVLLSATAAVLLAAIAAGTLFSRRVTARLGLLKANAEEVVKGNLDLQTGPVLKRNCWDIMGCGNRTCPAYGDMRRRCWHVAGTLCRACEGVEGKSADTCRECPVWRHSQGDEIQDLAEAFDVMALSLKSRIGELKEAEESLRVRERLLGAILDASPDLLGLLDENLAYRRCNRAFAEAVGRRVEEVDGATDADLFPAGTAALRAAEHRQVLESGRKLEMESGRETGDGARLHHTVIVPVSDDRGRVVGVLRTARDVTELNRYRDRTLQSQKMESLGRLVGGVAHEINTPLGIILGYAQLLAEDAPEGGQLRSDLQTIERQAKACRKIVADLLGFSRQTAGDTTQMDVNDTLRESVSLVRHSFGLDRVRILLAPDPAAPRVVGDPERLRQVWVNLLANARDAMPGGGLIRVGSRFDPASAVLSVRVSDTGQGIPAEALARIFDPFYTTKPAGKGTGLGLSVSFGIVRDLGGTIRAESPNPDPPSPADLPEGAEPGPGAVFTVDIPTGGAAAEGA